MGCLIAALVAACSSPSPDDAGGGAGKGGDVFGASATEPGGDAGTGPAPASTCPPSPAPAVFGNAVCICGDFADVGNLAIKSAAPGNAGSIGVNGTTKVVNNTNVSGSWASHGRFDAIGNVQIAESLYTESDLSVAGNLDVKKNLAVGGALSGYGRLAVGGELRAAGVDSILGYQQIKAKGSYVPPTALPCGCGGLDVVAEVAKAKLSNDNAAHGLPSTLGAIGAIDLTLATGRYYFSGVKTIGLDRLRVSGAVSLYVDGSLDDIGAEKIDFAPGATLDLYVSGAVRTVGYVRLGDAAQPSALRLYVGGANDVSLAVGAQIFHGAIYAPKATLRYVGYTKIEGALFVNELHGTGDLEIGAARPAAPPADVCSVPPAAPPSTGQTPEIR